jgi:hypothetical protein
LTRQIARSGARRPAVLARFGAPPSPSVCTVLLMRTENLVLLAIGHVLALAAIVNLIVREEWMFLGIGVLLVVASDVFLFRSLRRARTHESGSYPS